MTFQPMADIIPVGTSGRAHVEHFDVSPADSMMSSLRGGSSYVPAGRYARLMVEGTLMMSDTRYEHITNYTVVRQSRGDVLIAGLGLGMIVLPILAKPDVRTVTVVEKSADVVDLVEAPLRARLTAEQNAKLTIVVGDIYDWRPVAKTKYDVLYFDIWPGQSTDDLEDMTTLHKAFRKYRAVGGWMESWNREALKARKRQGADFPPLTGVPRCGRIGT